jgi:hypothetical protein
MSNAESKRVPKTQTAACGGPPKPPKKTVRGIEDGSPEPEFTKLDSVNAKIHLSERIIHGISEKLHSSHLSVAERTKLQKALEDMRADQKRFFKQKREFESQTG